MPVEEKEVLPIVEVVPPNRTERRAAVRDAKKLAKKGPDAMFTQAERQAKITAILLQLATLEITDYLTDAVRGIFDNYIKTGEAIEYEIPLPDVHRSLIINLHSYRKRAAPYVNLRNMPGGFPSSRVARNYAELEEKIKLMKSAQ
jgi:hypothetical protein